jgi:hypothetical protein
MGVTPTGGFWLVGGLDGGQSVDAGLEGRQPAAVDEDMISLKVR